MPTFNLNTDELTILSNKLERAGRSKLPLAIRDTLNEMAFQMKKTEIKKSASQHFDYQRQKNLFDFTTRVTKAKGFNTKTMKSQVGIANLSGKNKLTKGLAQQEIGGDIKKKTTPLDPARTSKNRGKKVRSRAQLQKLDPIDARKLRKNKFIAKAISSKKKQRMLLVEGKSGHDLIGRVRSFKRRKATVNIKIDWLYRIKDGQNIKLDRRPFIKKARNVTGSKMDKIFVEKANRRLR